MKMNLSKLCLCILLSACASGPNDNNSLISKEHALQPESPAPTKEPPTTAFVDAQGLKPSKESTLSALQNPNQPCIPDYEKATERRKYASLKGHVYDHLGHAVANAKITLKFEYFDRELYRVQAIQHCQLKSEYTTTSDESGAYYFDNIKQFSQLSLSASKSGYIKHTVILPQVEDRFFTQALRDRFGRKIPEAYLIDYLENGFDFGSPQQAVLPENKHNALLDLPQIFFISPLWSGNAPLLNAQAQFIITFTEPMQIKSVEQNLIFSHSQHDITVTETSTEEPLWGIEAFESNWNPNQTTLTLKSKPGKHFPAFNTAIDSAMTGGLSRYLDSQEMAQAKASYYQINFNRRDGVIRDQKGIPRDKDYIFFSGKYRDSLRFGIEADEQSPALTGLTTQDNTIYLHYSEPMLIQTLSQNWVASRDGTPHKAPAAYTDLKTPALSISAQTAAKNYFIAWVREGQPILGPIQLSEIGGEAHFDDSDPEHKTIRLNLDRNHEALSFVTGEQLWQAGDTLWVEVSESVEDPAGNPISAQQRKVKYLIP